MESLETKDIGPFTIEVSGDDLVREIMDIYPNDRVTKVINSLLLELENEYVDSREYFVRLAITLLHKAVYIDYHDGELDPNSFAQDLKLEEDKHLINDLVAVMKKYYELGFYHDE